MTTFAFINKNNRFMKRILFFALLAGSVFFTGCEKRETKGGDADLVVYGKIYQANVTPGGGPDQVSAIADAMVIKDGRYIYVGSVEEAQKKVTEKTQVIDRRNMGIIVPGMTEGHGHYLNGSVVESMDMLKLNEAQSYQGILDLLDKHCEKIKDGTLPKKNIFGQGFNYPLIKGAGGFNEHGTNIAADIDAVAHKYGLDDLLIFLSDGDVHRCFVNTNCIKKAGMVNEDGTIKEEARHIQGGEAVTYEKDGKLYPTGQFTEQANSLMRNCGMDFSELLTVGVLNNGLAKMQRTLLSNGYTNAVCAWANFFDRTTFYNLLKNTDVAGQLFVNIVESYCIETWMDYDNELSNALNFKTIMASRHLHPDYVKFFMDGVTETGTGLIYDYYLEEDGKTPTTNCGVQIWNEEVFGSLVAKVNGNGMSVHTHTFGDKAVQLVVSAYSQYGKKEMRNSIAHARNITEESYQIIANNNIVVSEAVPLHIGPAEWVKIRYGKLLPILPDKYSNEAYPIKSLMRKGIVGTSSTDYPATSGCPIHPFKIMEIAVTGYLRDLGEYGGPFWTEECVSPEQMLQMLTINGAYQLGLEAERGSIEEGKYADFVIVDKDVLTCPHNEIGDANIVATYFEGAKVSN